MYKRTVVPALQHFHDRMILFCKVEHRIILESTPHDPSVIDYLAKNIVRRIKSVSTLHSSKCLVHTWTQSDPFSFYEVTIIIVT